MNVRRHRKAIEKLYEDKCTISRYGPVKQPNGSTKQELQAIHTDKPCRISQKSLGANGQTESVNNISYETKLFVSPDIEIKQGDTVNVTRGTLVRLYTAGEPYPYSTHQEINLQRKDKA
ncbi:ABC transporter ATP-binding protein [Paenibacillus macquariensis]|uniref:ABC transporter ATP-binding protein n=1 Tax=Paenibacillus macquariensis TaxID=948756 RepID=A0ABY1JXE7_9BACL|nr:ABC transporter ATP-binding protein [Paenibacillus macquariensis]MEC0089335.1 ABC transporter ATP-binding protein [Paenibacillus macquariensis]OAB33263.1 ABC transporter ATP-binding protein [Paenibacillus macquariensis subsp. macquariensis]SIQ93559.1 hypothetical protein SAMN05421578_105123 [Paenibacillus macquariensis]